MSNVEKTEMGLVELLISIRRRLPLFLTILALSVGGAAAYLAKLTPSYRIEAKVAAYSVDELESLMAPEKLEGPALLKAFVATLESQTFRRAFFQRNVLETMKSEAGTATLDTQALFNRFNTRLVVKQMDQYATVNFAYPQPQIAEKWIGDLLLSANTETIRLMQAAHTKKIALLRDKIARRELLYAKVRTETIRGIANDARQLSKILGIPINSSVFQAIGSSDRAFYDLHDELHALLPETLPLSSVVKTESGATASPHAVGPGALFIFLYALIAGTILGALAVMAWEYLSSLFGKRRSFAFGE